MSDDISDHLVVAPRWLKGLQDKSRWNQHQESSSPPKQLMGMLMGRIQRWREKRKGPVWGPSLSYKALIVHCSPWEIWGAALDLS